ncbi:MAG: hypothetical protein MUE33_02205 [Cytophagaceae bacterium]|jgi:hypothetical protein|nr:hypothetical protein [Cytophagaceae bacterium]
MKIKKGIYSLILICLANYTLLAQKYFIPDVNFIRYLKAAYPQVLDIDDSLRIDIAETITTNINCPNYGIENLDGIQFFKNTTVLDIYDNRIHYLPPLDNLTKLTQILAFNNDLSSIPDISNLTLLYRLYLGKNKLTNIPSLDNNVNLRELHIEKNLLTTLPSLASLTQLVSLHVGENVHLSQLPNLSTLVNLRDLYFYKCNFTTYPNISNNNQLVRIYSGYNTYTSLPDFSIFPNLDVVEITYSNLTFEDILPLTTYPGFDTIFSYTPQNKIGIETTVSLPELSSFIIDVGIDAGVTSNRYIWYKNGNPIDTTSVPIFVIAPLNINDGGTYSCSVLNTSPLLYTVTLTSFAYTLNVTNPCMNILNVQYVTTDAICNGKGTLEVNPSTIVGGVRPFTYSLTNSFSGLSYRSSNGLFQEISDGTYTLKITDNIGCTRTLSSITIIRKEGNPSDCKGFAITPDGDGINDHIYIEEAGTATIYNSSGKVIQTLTTPGYWDGTSSSGEIVGDYYLIKINSSKTITITVIY